MYSRLSRGWKLAQLGQKTYMKTAAPAQVPTESTQRNLMSMDNAAPSGMQKQALAPSQMLIDSAASETHLEKTPPQMPEETAPLEISEYTPVQPMETAATVAEADETKTISIQIPPFLEPSNMSMDPETDLYQMALCERVIDDALTETVGSSNDNSYLEFENSSLLQELLQSIDNSHTTHEQQMDIDDTVVSVQTESVVVMHVESQSTSNATEGNTAAAAAVGDTVVQPELVTEMSTVSTDNVNQAKPGSQSTTNEASKLADKHPLLEACHCRSNCSNSISDDQRKIIHSEFWKIPSYNCRKQWLFSKITGKDRSDANKRSFIKYLLPDGSGNDVQVCQKMFLGTLGYTSNKVVVAMMKSVNLNQNMLVPPADKRGQHAPKHKMPEANVSHIQEHIKSYHPTISHYRRAHAPNRLYLSPEITIKEMHQDFKHKNPNMACSYATYRKIVKQMNISFVKLGEEECEICEAHNLHVHDNETEENCAQCNDWKDHSERAKVSRTAYKADVETATVHSAEDETKYLSVDLQKVILLPRLPGMKACIFTRRLVVFNHTYAPLGCQTEKPIAVIWHEGVSGRNAEDIASAFLATLHHPENRNVKHFVIWCDNCAGQNKCWVLYTALAAEMNRPNNIIESIVIKYLEPGHTFMSADSFHHKVENQMRHAKNVYDFDEFEALVSACGIPLRMKAEDFQQWKNESTTAKGVQKPQLHPLKQVKFVKGETALHYKTDHNSTTWNRVEFLKKKVLQQITHLSETTPSRNEPRGIQASKLAGIKKQLLPIIPRNRWTFWEKMKTSTDSSDLASEYD